MCIQCGYKTVTPVQIANCFGALNQDAISYRAVRVYFACLSVVATREAAKRDAVKRGRKPREEVRYRISELCAATGLKTSAVKKELRSLKKVELLSWSEKVLIVRSDSLPGTEALLQSCSGRRSALRPIPVPRPVLRFIARSTKPALGKTVIAYILRGLSIDRKDASIRSAGTVKASWIADVFGLSLRSVKGARKELICSGFITKDTGSFQRKLNRDGSYFQVNLSWHEGKEEGLRISPLTPKSRANFAHPYKYKKTSYEFKNQKTQSAALKPSGVFKSKAEGGPSLKDIQREDLKSFPRLRVLYAQAAHAGWLKSSESNFLNWVAAAVRANSVAARDPVRVFVSIVRRGQWHLITQTQEERARAAIRHYQEADDENVAHRREDDVAAKRH